MAPLTEDKTMKHRIAETEMHSRGVPVKRIEDKHIVVFWDKEVDDYTHIGPFESEEEANEWVAGYKVPVTVWVTSLIHPKSID